jgi:hypothetical protein
VLFTFLWATNCVHLVASQNLPRESGRVEGCEELPLDREGEHCLLRREGALIACWLPVPPLPREVQPSRQKQLLDVVSVVLVQPREISYYIKRVKSYLMSVLSFCIKRKSVKL